MYSTGPVDLWVGIGSGTSSVARFLGHGKKAPRLEKLRNYVDVPCDLGGQRTAFDRMYDGQIVRVSVDLVRYHEDVLLLIEDAAATFAQEGLPGVDAEGDVGSHMRTRKPCATRPTGSCAPATTSSPLLWTRRC
jgi:hypothetical protein